MEQILSQISEFEKDVLDGLSSTPKSIPSRYFYDETGDKLFQQIMTLDEYYLTKAEFEILNTYGEEIIQKYLHDTFQLVELGAGDGLKTKILLDEVFASGKKFNYLPVDISTHALESLMTDLHANYPHLNGHGISDDYFSALKKINGVEKQKVVMFLGSNIGNYTPPEAENFLIEMRNNLQPDDILLIGIDLKKDPEVIRRAYDDSQGVTKEFNLNLLRRINRELGGNFKLEDFDHLPIYDSASGAAKSFLISKKDQTVKINAISKTFSFAKNELISTEISQKYSLEEIADMSERTGFELQSNYLDQKGYFVDTIWKAV